MVRQPLVHGNLLRPGVLSEEDGYVASASERGSTARRFDLRRLAAAVEFRVRGGIRRHGRGPLMARGVQGAILRGFGARDHTATVIETESIAPHFVRVRMMSPTLFEDAEAEPAAWLRFWFPDPDGSDTELQRAYTISAAD